MSYQDQVGQLKDAGFSGQDIQSWSDNQAVKLRQGGFSQDEVDSYQGMKAPPSGQPQVYGRLPTDDDFKNAASVVLKGNDHPFYEKAVDSLKGLFSQTGVEPAEAVKASQEIPSFRSIMENGGSAPSPTWGEYGTKILHEGGSAIASGMQGLSVMHSYLNPDDPGVSQSEQGANPETSQMYQKGAAFQKWLNDKFASNPETEKNNPIKMGLAGGVGSLVPLIATGGVGMVATGAGSAYEEAKQAGAPIEKATAYATKMGGVWGALGVADVGMFLKPIERSAPGLIPWITAKATQALRSGATFAGTNELGSWLSSEIGQAADIPIQYKPTAQQIIVNATLGAVAGMAGPASVKRGAETEKPTAEKPILEGQPPPTEPSAAGAAPSLTPAYHFDSDTYGLKNNKGEFVQHGFGSEEEAARIGQMQDKVIAPGPSRIEPEVIDRYKKTISDQAEKANISLTPEQLQAAATKMAESHNPPQPLEVTPRELKEVTPEEKIAEQPEQKSLAERAYEQGELFDKHEGEDFLYQKNSLNRGILSARREPPPEVGDMLDFVERVAPKAKLEFQNALAGGEHGYYDPVHDLIMIARTSPDQWNTLGHESFHAIESLLTDQEWKTLVNEANKKELFKKYDIGRYDKPEDHDREMLAHWFGDYASGERMRMSPESRTLFEKVKDILASFAQKLRELFGNQSADDIFEKVYGGDVGAREGANREAAEGVAYQKADEKKPSIADAIRGIRDTISPTSAGDLAKREEVSIRENYGQAKRQRAVAETALNEFARQANKMTPEDHADFYNYVEGRSKGTQLQNKQFQAMADTVRDVYQQWKNILQGMPETRMMNFVTDYFTHQWADGQDKKIQEFMNSWWQQGSGKNLKERKIPTIADGLAYGLKLAEPNPVRAVSRYVGSMSNYVASVGVLRTINNDLGGGYFADGKQPEGYAPLVGRNAERIENAKVDAESGKIVPARSLHLYAPKQVADLYNAFYSKGFEDTKLKPAYMLARNAINTNTLMELGLSAYHASTITMQSLNQDVGRFLRNAGAGDWEGVVDAVKGLVTPALHFREGFKLMDQYKNLEDHGIDMERMADEFAKSNMRIGLDPLSNVSTHGGFYKAYQRGELPQVIDRMKSQMKEGYGIGALKSGAEAVARVVSDVSHPLFNVYVPAIKMSAFHDLMGDWLRQHPGTSDAEIAENRVRIGDMVEDRFGEMNMENIFWNKKAKELLGLGLRAPGWDIGLVRQAGGAGYDVYRMIKDGIKGNGFDPNRLDRPLFIVGAAITYAAINSAMTYLKTGVSPDDQKFKDLIAYATGGMYKAFGMHPERGELPGHGREMLQMAPIPGQGPLSGITQEAANKVATLPKKAYETATNTDWTGKPIYDPKSKNWYQRIPGVAQAVHIASGFEPFSMEQLFQGKPEGSNLSLAERFMGVRAAGAKIVNPEGLRKFNEEKRH